MELNFASPLELLVAAILSAQTTDRKVNEVTRVLFARYRTATDYAAADRAELEKWPPGLSRPQARLRRMRSGPLVPVVRHGPDRRGDRPQARQDRSLFVTGPGCWCALLGTAARS